MIAGSLYCYTAADGIVVLVIEGKGQAGQNRSPYILCFQAFLRMKEGRANAFRREKLEVGENE
jgi:hypothetical protein